MTDCNGCGCGRQAAHRTQPSSEALMIPSSGPYDGMFGSTRRLTG